MFPVIKDFAKYANVIPADFEVMKKNLEEGNSVSIIPGGVREMMTTTDEKNIRLVLKNRKGIFRLALLTGRPLVPLITYGESELFPPVESTFMNMLNTIAYSTFKIAMPITSFTAIQNWIELYYRPLSLVTTHTGKAIEVEKTETPTDEDISVLREKYINAVKSLFDETHPKEYTLTID
jgi:2-acylglycerol O-acyltransferase 2